MPRIADLAPMRERLAGMAGDLDLAVAHGRMRADELDRRDAGLRRWRPRRAAHHRDRRGRARHPGADTIIVWRPERFGLAQLHQLRGRVGRGRQRGACYLLHEPDALPSAAATAPARQLGDLREPGRRLRDQRAAISTCAAPAASRAMSRPGTSSASAPASIGICWTRRCGGHEARRWPRNGRPSWRWGLPPSIPAGLCARAGTAPRALRPARACWHGRGIGRARRGDRRPLRRAAAGGRATAPPGWPAAALPQPGHRAAGGRAQGGCGHAAGRIRAG